MSRLLLIQCTLPLAHALGNSTKYRKRRRSLSLVANIMKDLGMTDNQKVACIVVFFVVIWTCRLMGWEIRPRSRYGDVVARQREVRRKKEERERREKKEKER